jgi:hypothetical protein
VKTYRGAKRSRELGMTTIRVRDERAPGTAVEHDLFHVVRHSPTGFNWGYGGSGPADTALSILTDCAGEELAERYYQRFKSDIVARWDDAFEITSDEIWDWIRCQERIDRATMGSHQSQAVRH